MFHCNHCNSNFSELKQKRCFYCLQTDTFFECSFELLIKFLLIDNTFSLNQINSHNIQGLNVIELKELLKTLNEVDVSYDIKKQRNKNFMNLKIKNLIQQKTA